MKSRPWLLDNWERVLFAAVGLAFLTISFYLILRARIPEGSAVFGLAFLSFIYANVARFKRFKGLGFEAELWEDKQREAAGLIERLRDVVSIYTREVVLGKVQAGRFARGVDWASNWKLFDDLVSKHNELGQKVDLTDVKKVMDDYFLFDMAMPEINNLRLAAEKGKTAARAKIDAEFGSPIRDNEGYSARFAQFRQIPPNIEDPFLISTREDLAAYALKQWKQTKLHLKTDFDVEAEVDVGTINRLRAISELYQSRPVKVTEELISWANRE
ncbi:hypothetical protein VE26_09895 [Devosia chinhatensis]|uniref:Uncharacterized protein n=2 Tax=Devosia chinhatensis TaxID=429727 RepID=A0A0F5FPA2_9HYPH|nr:hypothetical protein VE26_09895 [Devosia chinhatensis]